MSNNSFLLIKRLITEHIRPYFKKLALASVAMLVLAGTSTLLVWLVRPALDKIFVAKNVSMLIYIPFAVVLIAVVKGIADYYQRYLMRDIGQRIITDLQIKLYDHLIHSDIEFLQKESTGKIISRFTNDIMMMRSAVSNLLSGVVKELLTVIFLIGLMFYNSPALSIIAFTVFPLAILPIMKLGKKMRKIANATQNELGEYTSALDDSFQAIRMIKSYNREDFEVSRAKKIVNKILKLYIKSAKTDSLSSPIMEMLSGVAIGAVIWYGGMQVINNVTTPGSFFSFIVAIITAYKPLKNLTSLNNSLQEGLSASSRVFAIFDNEPKIKDQVNPIEFDDCDGDVEFTNVTFTYPSGNIAINNFNMKIPAHKTTAIVGLSGGGKSTILNLLIRLYDVDSGQITIDNKNIQSIRIKDLRKNIAMVGQEVMLFDDTILANIGYGKLDATKDEIIDAAKAAAADDFICQMQNGYSEVIGQQGSKLSGGQRQRISIARAILKNAPILVFDEATSSLDVISEKRIQENLLQKRNGKTNIIIAHRLSTIVKADLIYVMKNGEIIEAGTHQQLIELKQEYYKLYQTFTQ